MQVQHLNRPAILAAIPTRSWWWLPLLATTLLCLNTFSSVHAEDDLDPASRVARVSYLKGEVYVQPTNEDGSVDSDQWIDAQLNRPLTSGDALSTDSNSRAELQMGDANLQMEEESRLHLFSLTDSRAQVQLDQGSINLYLPRDMDDRIDVITSNARVSLREAGTYRITAWDDDVTEVRVRDGRADVRGTNQSYPVRDGEQLTLRGVNRLSVAYDDVPRMDDFDRWAAARNDRPNRVTSRRYVDADVIGYEDLDDYGDWRYVGDYGYVWMPTHISVGWAPYRFGHWLWISPWGWTWVDDAPWGFAPFHYGRWAEIDHRWCWVPGPRTVRAVYAPALVAWVGTPSVSVSIGIGSNVGWFPLGPRDVYRPIYRSSERYVRSVNLSNSRLSAPEFERDFRRQPHELNYSNRSAATVVSSQTFQHARPVQGNLVKSDPSHLTITGRAPDIRADRSSRMGEARERSLPTINRSTRMPTPNNSPRERIDEPVRARPSFGESSVSRNNEPRMTAPNSSPAITAPRTERNTPVWNRPALPDMNRGNERSVGRGSDNRNWERNTPANPVERPAPRDIPRDVPRDNVLRERRPIAVEPVRPASPPQQMAPQQPNQRGNDNGNGDNGRRGRFGDQERR